MDNDKVIIELMIWEMLAVSFNFGHIFGQWFGISI